VPERIATRPDCTRPDCTRPDCTRQALKPPSELTIARRVCIRSIRKHSMSDVQHLCALVPKVHAEEARRALDHACLLDVGVRAFSHEDAVALPLLDCAKTSLITCDSTPEAEAKGACGLLPWSDDHAPLRTFVVAAPPPRRKGARLLNTAMERVLTAWRKTSMVGHDGIDVLLGDKALPKRWEKLGDVVLFAPRGMFDTDTPEAAALAGLAPDCRSAIYAALASALGVQRLGVQGVIEESLHRKSTARLFWPEGCSDGWTIQRENGISYGLDVTRSMFSSGNGTEKARVSQFDCCGKVVVDLYAGIGYFSLPYLVHANAQHLHACEWDDDALKALAHNVRANGVEGRCTIHAGDNLHAVISIARAVAAQRMDSKGTDTPAVEAEEAFDEKRTAVAMDDTPTVDLEAARVAHHVNLGLIPSSEAAWRVALMVLRPEGGVLHVHANVGSSSSEEHIFCIHLVQTLSHLATSEAVGRAKEFSHVTVIHVERVKSYAPKVNHVVVDVHVGRVSDQ
jgi:tRNA wybutosine-synthesizing protein 2